MEQIKIPSGVSIPPKTRRRIGAFNRLLTQRENKIVTFDLVSGTRKPKDSYEQSRLNKLLFNLDIDKTSKADYLAALGSDIDRCNNELQTLKTRI